MTTVLNPVELDPLDPPTEEAQGQVIALVGPPNAGKSTLFNGLTGGRAKVGNYPGVTVELREGPLRGVEGLDATVIDLPGITGLNPRSLDAKVTVDVLSGESEAVSRPDLIIAVVDSGQLRRQLPFLASLTALGLPMIVALNMYDLAERDGVKLDTAALSEALGVPVVTTTAPRGKGRADLLAELDKRSAAVPNTLKGDELKVLGDRVLLEEPELNKFTRAVDSVVLHPVLGVLLLVGILFFVFQAVFAWAAVPMDMIDAGVGALGSAVAGVLPGESWFESLLVDGIIAGVGAVVIFLPQIVILFFFILLLEMTGYMSRAAFLVDELMLKAGLNGRAFIPLLSSFACAIPGMMAARTLDNERDRITTILVAPLMTCSARLPVYTVLIAAFVPATKVGPFGLQGLVMFTLFALAVVFGVLVAFVLRKTVTKGGTQNLLMELPTYKFPSVTDLLLGLWRRAVIFLRRAGTVIFMVSIVLWFLVSYPGDTLRESFAGRIGTFIEPIFKPIGFTLEMVIALVPGIAAREVAVGALGTVYAVQDAEEHTENLSAVLAQEWTLPAALAFLAWYIFAPQCISTIAVARRELNSAKWTWFMVLYLTGLAYVGAGVTYWGAKAILG